MSSFWKVAALAALVVSTNAAAVEPRQLFTAPTAKIKNGTVVGSTDYINQVDNFMGIPYALQPTSTRRLTNPTSMSAFDGSTFTATGTPIACPAFLQGTPLSSPQSAAAQATNTAIFSNAAFQDESDSATGEACLNLNVQRSAGVKAGQKVPVMLYIYGGGFEAGYSSFYDGTPLIKKASALGLPLVYVAMSYRLSGLGFLPGKEMAGNANLGLKDQRLAMKWVSENIAAFGGDPSRVTLWGESAGSISVFDHLIIDGGNLDYNGTPLFIGAIMNSGNILPALPIDAPFNQAIYDEVVAAADCTDSVNTLECLKSVSEATIIAAQTVEHGNADYQSLHFAYQPRPDPTDNFYPVSPEEAVSSGAYARVPIIIGDQEDEGTCFSLAQNNVTTTDDLIGYMQIYFPETDPQDVATLVNAYPDDPAAGSPFRTGDNNQYYAQYKRLAAILGDFYFTLVRRIFLASFISEGLTAYSYLNTYLYGTSFLGTLHGADIVNDRFLALSQIAMNATQQYYISFTYYQDPNHIAAAVQWPTYDSTDRKLLNFTHDTILIGDDFFREDEYQTMAPLINAGKLRT